MDVIGTATPVLSGLTDQYTYSLRTTEYTPEATATFMMVQFRNFYTEACCLRQPAFKSEALLSSNFKRILHEDQKVLEKLSK